jgi:hypothetical protein
MLRFSCTCGRPWVEDPVHHGAWHTQKLIPVNAIECLLSEGWVPISTLDQGGLDALADYSDPAQDKDMLAAIGLAFTRDEFVDAVPTLKHLKGTDPREIWTKLKHQKGQSLWLSDGTECTFAGTTGHPVREPENWLYVCHVPRKKAQAAAEKYKQAAERYKEKILRPGWGRDT